MILYCGVWSGDIEVKKKYKECDRINMIDDGFGRSSKRGVKENDRNKNIYGTIKRQTKDRI